MLTHLRAYRSSSIFPSSAGITFCWLFRNFHVVSYFFLCNWLPPTFRTSTRAPPRCWKGERTWILCVAAKGLKKTRLVNRLALLRESFSFTTIILSPPYARGISQGSTSVFYTVSWNRPQNLFPYASSRKKLNSPKNNITDYKESTEPAPKSVNAFLWVHNYAPELLKMANGPYTLLSRWICNPKSCKLYYFSTCFYLYLRQSLGRGALAQR